MNHGSLFSGIGGFDLASEWMGWTNVFHCEYNPFGQRVLKHYWPNSITYGDIKQTDFTIHRGQIDILTGGFPCQPFSSAGKRKGTEDDRHLWPEMLRAIREIQPSFVVGENVRGLLNWSGGLVFEQVQIDLENEGYKVTPFLLPACAVNAPHRRDRVWFVAHAIGSRHGGITKATGSNQSECSRGMATDKRHNGNEVWSKTQRCGEASENPHEDGRGGIEREEEPKERRFGDVGAGDNEWVRADNENVGTTADTQSHGDRGGLRRVATTDEGLRQPQEHREDNGQLGHDGNKWDVTNPGSSRWEDGIHGERGIKRGEANQFRNPHKESPSRWSNFPTQPPVCSRNDGLPSRLSGITVSRHRKESIMAYGNAIVPQVAYEIFKAIEATRI